MRCSLLVLVALMVALAVPVQGQRFLTRKVGDCQRDLNNSKDPAARRAAAFALGRMGDTAEVAIRDLARAVHYDRDFGVRDMAANAIGEIVVALGPYAAPRHWADAGKTLQGALGHKDARVRRSAAYALGAFGNLATPVADDLRKGLEDDSATVRQNAAWALGRLGTGASAAAVEDLCRSLKDPNVLVRRDAAAALGNLGRMASRDPAKSPGRLRDAVKVAAEPLLNMFKAESDEVVRKTALQALASLVGPDHARYASDLYPLLESKDRETARGAAYVLARIGGKHAQKAVPVLGEALADPDPSVQAVAAACLAEMGPDASAAIADLGRALSASRDPYVRRNCAIALGRAGPEAKAAILALAQAMEPMSAPPDPDRARAYDEAREQAAEAIAKIGYPNNEAALPAIRRTIEKDRIARVRQFCVWALDRCHDLEERDMLPVLTKVLSEKSTDPRDVLVRYETACLLARQLKERAPDKAVEVLLHMLGNTELRVFKGTSASVDRTGDEGRGGASSTRADVGGDARFMAAEALGKLGEKGKTKKVREALQRAATDKDPMLSKKAKDALEALDLGG